MSLVVIGVYGNVVKNTDRPIEDLVHLKLDDVLGHRKAGRQPLKAVRDA